jgi:hypothetical protein
VVYQTQKNVFQKESQMKKALHPPQAQTPLFYSAPHHRKKRNKKKEKKERIVWSPDSKPKRIVWL